MPLSTKQCEYLALAWQCMESEPKIDYEKFRRIAGLASANSARELLRVTKKKLREEYGAAAMTSTTTATTPATPTKGGQFNGIIDSAPSTPSRGKTTPGKAKATGTPNGHGGANTKRGRPPGDLSRQVHSNDHEMFSPKKIKVEASTGGLAGDDNDDMPME